MSPPVWRALWLSAQQLWTELTPPPASGGAHRDDFHMLTVNKSQLFHCFVIISSA